MSEPVVTTFGWVPPFARGFVRDHRVRWALEEVGRSYRVEPVDFATVKGPDFRRVQPFGQVPIYADDEVMIGESGAIVLHIARGSPGLLPDDPAAHARAEQWVFAALNSVEPFVFDLGMCDLFEADKPWSAQRRPSVVERVDGRLADVAAALAGPYLDGEAFTAGDLMMASAVRQIGDRGIVERHPALAEWLARCEARPAFARSMADHLAPFGEQEEAA